ncbi:RNA-binding domain-containing protein [Hysterangium stoloniferum]|nr:RNA-binding domain-containing protein [Hysterangium stoloniferum]
MEEGTVRKNTIFVGGVSEDVDEEALVELFSTFGDIVDVQLPSSATNPALAAEAKHRGFAFVTFTQALDAQDAIDNMDMNEYRGRVLKVNLAKPQKTPIQGAGNRAIWESEEWLQTYAKHSATRGGGNQADQQKTSKKDDDEEQVMEE